MSVNFYQFHDDEMRPGLICVGPTKVVCPILSAKDFVRHFHGYCLYTDLETGEHFIGVSRVRSASRFRRLMREAGVEFTLCEYLPASFKPGGPKGRATPWDGVRQN